MTTTKICPKCGDNIQWEQNRLFWEVYHGACLNKNCDFTDYDGGD